MSLNIKEYSLKFLLHCVIQWAYNNDKRLYENMDAYFNSFECRHDLNDKEKSLTNEIILSTDFDPKEFLKEAIAKCDYHDMLKFNWCFINEGNRKGSYVYGVFEEHKYKFLIPFIKEQEKFLKENNLLAWNKSTDIKKYEHFRWHIQNFIDNPKNRIHSLGLLPVFSGNLNADTFLNIGSSYNDDSNTFKSILIYILENNIVPDYNYKEIEFHDPINPDHDNVRKINKSGKHPGFWYLVYLKGDDLKWIYKNKIKKNKLSYIDKCNWNYINNLPKEDNSFYTKLFLFIK